MVYHLTKPNTLETSIFSSDAAVISVLGSIVNYDDTQNVRLLVVYSGDITLNTTIASAHTSTIEAYYNFGQLSCKREINNVYQNISLSSPFSAPSTLQVTSVISYPATGSSVAIKASRIKSTTMIDVLNDNFNTIFTFNRDSFDTSIYNPSIFPVLGTRLNSTRYATVPVTKSITLAPYLLYTIENGNKFVETGPSLEYTVVDSQYTDFSITTTRVYDQGEYVSFVSNDNMDIVPELQVTLDISIGQVIPLVYPYGFIHSATKDNYCATILFPNENSTNFIFTYTMERFSTIPIATPPGGRSENVPPLILEFDILPLGGYTSVYRIKVVDVSGLFSITHSIGGGTEHRYGQDSLVSGTMYNGTFEFSSETYVLDVFTVSLLDHCLNKFEAQPTEWITPVLRTPSLPLSKMTFSLMDIQIFQFHINDVDVTNQDGQNWLYVLWKGADVTLKPRLIILKPEDNTENGQLMYRDFEQGSFEGYWNSTLKVFMIPFTLQKNLFEGPVDYLFATVPYTTSGVLISRFGAKAQLNVISSYADRLPPMVKSVVAVPSPTHTIDINTDNSIGWLIEIEDSVNGFDRGYVNITSNINPIPTRVELNQDTRVTGDIYLGRYHVGKDLPKMGVSQTYTFSIWLVDTSGNIGDSSDTTSTIDPMFNIYSTLSLAQLTIQVIYSLVVVDDNPPYLTSMNLSKTLVDVTSMQQDRTFLVEFTIKDDGSGVLVENAPFVYVSSYLWNILRFPSYKIHDSAQHIFQGVTVATEVTFRSEITLPYGFGSSSPLAATPVDKAYISVYGIYDNTLTINGYCVAEMPLPTQSTIDLQRSYDPILERHSKIYAQGGELTIYGRAFPDAFSLLLSDTTPTDNKLIINGPYPFQSGTIFVFNLPPFNPLTMMFNLTLTLNRLLASNTITIVPSPNPPIPPTTPLFCGSTCNSPHGYCSSGSCVCLDGYTGVNCTTPPFDPSCLDPAPCNSHVYLDPQFSVLIDPSETPAGATCRGTSNALSTSKLIAIIVPVVVISLAIIVASVYTIHRRQRFSKEKIKMEAKLKRLSENK
eukprot:gene3748-4322_t